jgi:HEAT repeat protein
MKRSRHTKLGSLSLLALLAVNITTATALAQSDRGETPRERLRQRYGHNREGTTDISEDLRRIRSDNPEERLEATRTLGASEDPKAVQYLQGAASDSDLRVRLKAIDELGNRMAKEATPLLVQQLFLRETEPIVQQRVLAALGKIRDPRSTQPICEFLARDLDPSTRATAIFALGEIGDERALHVLADLAADGTDPTARRLADEAARKINHKAPPPLEIPALAEDRKR